MNDPILGFFHQWVLEFSKNFEDVYVICLNVKKHTLPSHVRVYSLGKESGKNKYVQLFRFYRYFFHIFFREGVDVVFFHMGAIYNVLAFPFYGIRTLFRIETRFVWWKTHGKLNLIGKIALRGVDQVLTAGSKSFNAQSNKVRVVGHAIDTNMFGFDTHTHHEDLRIVIVGRVTPIKKIERALQALVVYACDGKKYTLDIIGPVTDVGYYEELLKFIARDEQLSVHFMGSKTPQELAQLYREYDVLLHPAYEAGFDKVVLEAMATGVIPITSIPSFEPVLAPYGLFVLNDNIDGYVRMLNHIQSQTEYERKKLQETLRAIVVNYHSITTLPERIFGNKSSH